MRDLILDPYLRNALADAFMDGTLLWVAASVARRPARWYRLLAGAGVGGIYNFWLALARDGFLPGWPLLTSPLVFWVLLPFFMLAVSFAPIKWPRLAKLGGIFFLFAILTWGLASTVRYYLHLLGYSFSPFFFVILEAGLALTVAELGWGAVHRQAMARVCQVPLTIEMGDFLLATEGYFDTGNRLRDPMTRRPVIVLDYLLIREALTPAARAFVEAMAEGGAPPLLPPDDPWLPRLRVIPYRTVERRSGLMPGLRVDRIHLGKGKLAVSHRSLVIGLELAGGLAREECRALVPPALWSWS